jgi:chromosome partitioning protein
MSKIISVFSHKGGVGKTTFIYNIAFELAERNKKVLLIDADSQMNLTSSIFGKFLTKNKLSI